MSQAEYATCHTLAGQARWVHFNRSLDTIISGKLGHNDDECADLMHKMAIICQEAADDIRDEDSNHRVTSCYSMIGALLYCNSGIKNTIGFVHEQ